MDTAPFAGIWIRLVAYAIDVVLLFVFVLLSQFALRPINPLLGGAPPTGGAVHLWVVFTVSLPLCLLLAAAWTLPRGATPGMRLFGMHVERRDGGHVTFMRAFVRAVVLLIPFELNHVALLHPKPIWTDAQPGFRIGFLVVDAVILAYVLTAWRSQYHQGPQDLAAGTVVLRAPRLQ